MKTKSSNILKGNMRQYSMVLVLALLIILFNLLTNGLLLKPLNITNLILQNGYVLILAIGMLPVIITARIDLSVGSVLAFVGAIAAIMIVNMKVSFGLTLLVCVATGVLIGAWHGFWIAYINIPAFITTLSSMFVFRGLTIAVLNGRSIGLFTDTFRYISSNYIPDFLGGPISLFGKELNLTTLVVGIVLCAFIIYRDISKRYAQNKYGFATLPYWFFIIKLVIVCAAVMVLSYFLAVYNGIPALLVLLVALVVIYSFIMSKTVFGRRIYAIGGNEAAARLSGINTKRLLFFTNINMGILCAVAGIVFAARLNAGTPKAGSGFELDAIASCFIGGASVYGGTGTIMGAILGCFIMGIMNNGMSIMGIAVDYQQVVKGLVVLFAVAIDMITKSKQK